MATHPARRRIELPAFVVALCVSAGGLLGAWAWWDAYSCTAELDEPKSALAKIVELEKKHKGEKGVYAGMEPCSFHPVGDTCLSRLGFSILGESLFAYRVDLTEAGFTATAVGAGGRHFGSVVRVDETGQLDLSGAMCGQ